MEQRCLQKEQRTPGHLNVLCSARMAFEGLHNIGNEVAVNLPAKMHRQTCWHLSLDHVALNNDNPQNNQVGLSARQARPRRHDTPADAAFLCLRQLPY